MLPELTLHMNRPCNRKSNAARIEKTSLNASTKFCAQLRIAFPLRSTTESASSGDGLVQWPKTPVVLQLLLLTEPWRVPWRSMEQAPWHFPRRRRVPEQSQPHQ